MSSENDEPPANMSADRNEMLPSLLPELLRHLGLDKEPQGVPSQASLLADLKNPAWYVRALSLIHI